LIGRNAVVSLDIYVDIIARYWENRDADLALPMARYMKSHFTFLGLPRPTRDRLQKDFLRAVRREKHIDWGFVGKCWELDQREYQYLAVDYLLVLRDEMQPGDLDRLETMLTRRSWWDTVDTIAVRLVGGLGLKYPELIRPRILVWAAGKDPWLRRSAILFQLKYKEHTDPDLLGELIEMNTGSGGFFIDKAIGWALREYSKTAPAWVKGFIASHELAPLSFREGSRYLTDEI
jgi:3-methyladenine DNA glycosylase AlkD